VQVTVAHAWLARRRGMRGEGVARLGSVGLVIALVAVLGAAAHAECGDGMLDGGEQCDSGALNGASCCTVDCTYVAAGTVCRSAHASCERPATCDGASGECPRNGVQPDCLAAQKCVVENPSLWGLRFNFGPSLTVDGCYSQCVAGGGNGYLCLSAVSGLCLCGTAAKPSSPAMPTSGCTSTCAGSDDECGGPSNHYTCYAAAPPTQTPTETATSTPTATATATATPTASHTPGVAPRLATPLIPGETSVDGSAGAHCRSIEICAVGAGTMPAASPCAVPDVVLGAGPSGADGRFAVAVAPLSIDRCVYAFDTCQGLTSTVACAQPPARAPAVSSGMLWLVFALQVLVGAYSIRDLRKGWRHGVGASR
jgi:hypothetical protein